MRNALLVVIVCLVSIANAQAIDNCVTDTFGYSFLDSDTTAPNAPTFNWVSIYNRGTRITGLGDDNVKGPIPIGFNFTYYWKQPNTVYVGSDGYVSFGDNFLSASPFQSLPSCQRPNNIIAPIMADLDFSVGTPSCWYWTNAADSFIIEYDSVQFWSTGGLLSFQIIFCQSDSSITLQYLTVQGAPYGGWTSTNSNVIGIENSIGNIGLQYLKDGLPANNLLHNNLAIKFFKTPITQPLIHDARVVCALNKQSGAIFLHPSDSIKIWTKIENSGSEYEEYNFVYASIINQYDSLDYFNAANIYCRPAGMIDSIMFNTQWMPSTTGRYCLNAQTALTSDMCRDNDSIQVELRVINSNDELAYDNGANTLFHWSRPAGFANQFVPPSYPWLVKGAKFAAFAPSSINMTISLYDDNGPNNSPGDVLAQNIVSVLGMSWFTVPFPDPGVTINDGSFFIGVTSPVYNQLSFYTDTVPPFSHRLWEYTGTWNLSRFNFSRDVCIRSLSLLGIEESPDNSINIQPVSISPNPFNNFVMIKFSNPIRENKSVSIYNSSGILVRYLRTKDDMVVWDGRNNIGLNLPNGCYFIKLNNDQTKFLHKVIIAR